MADRDRTASGPWFEHWDQDAEIHGTEWPCLFLEAIPLAHVLALTGFVIASTNFRVIRYTTDEPQT
jgi:hypothetical protein